MPKVIITGWRYGLQKIKLTKLQMERLNMGLKASKNNVDMLLDGKFIELDIPDLKTAKLFMLEADWLGTDCTLIE